MTRRRVAARPRTLLVAGLIGLAGVAAAGELGALRGMEERSYDARFEVRGAQPADGVAIIAIDERTFSSIDATWPLQRRLHARVIDQLRKAGARPIVYDVQFTEPSGSDADDLALFDAVARTPGTILATGERDGRGRTKVLGGDEQLAEIGSRAASSTFMHDRSGVIREYGRDDGKLETLAYATAKQLGKAPAAGRFNADGRALIDFRGPAGTFPSYSFADVLSGKVPASKLRGKVVVVGATAPVLQDVHPTSASGTRLMSGPEIQANAIWTAEHGNPLQTPPGWTAAALAALLALLGTVAVVRLGPLRGLALAAFGSVGFAGISIAAFGAGLVLPVAVPLAALAAAVACSSLVAFAAEITARIRLTAYSEQLEAEVAERTSALVESQLEVVLRLARTAELRDDDTGEHVDRMSNLCRDVALELGFSQADAEMIRYAAALHDIGKIGVPDAILLKPGKLTPEEFDIMRYHVVHGATILEDADSPLLILAEEITRTHHEKWDGTGYPAKIAGEDIPLTGRIAAVCDVFDALSSDRPYKKAWPPEEVRAEIDAQRGRHFDTRVVDALFAVLDRRAAESPAKPEPVVAPTGEAAAEPESSAGRPPLAA
ncbi:MAG: CHASE2 domain-containing protein [Solirubrobacteraceae bacterium]|nr:CHASE2 domain-containing protein [Solirubrobacteraceae bacterium]